MEDWFGYSTSISADGSAFAVGAPLNDDNGADSGQVRVYKFKSLVDGYTQVGFGINGETTGDTFGHSMSMSADGTTLVVGAPYNDGSGANSGHVRVYKYNLSTNSYEQVGSDINGKISGDAFGYSVSMSADGTVFVVGAPYNDNNGMASGHVRVYKYSPLLNEYGQIGVDINGEAASNLFGYSVSISADGTTFVVGAPFNDNSGHIRVYKYNASMARYLQFGSDIDGEGLLDSFGFSVSMSADGSALVVGAPFNDGNGSNSGHVRVYKLNASTGSGSSYVKVGLDINGEAVGDNFGSSVSMSADGATFVVGAPKSDANGISSGRVRFYTYSPSIQSYTQDINNILDGGNFGGTFGNSVSMSANGKAVVIGASQNDGSGIGAGHIRVFQIIPEPTKAPTKSPSKAPAVPVAVAVPFTAPIAAPLPMKSPVSVPFAVSPPIQGPAVVTAPSNGTKAPISAAPVMKTPKDCGLFGLNVFCLRRGGCGFVRRLFNINGCS